MSLHALSKQSPSGHHSRYQFSGRRDHHRNSTPNRHAYHPVIIHPYGDGSTSPLTGIKVTDAETISRPEQGLKMRSPRICHLRNGLGRFLEMHRCFHDVRERVVSRSTFERRRGVLLKREIQFPISPAPCKNRIGCTDDHLVNQDTQCPPIHGRGVPMRIDDLGGDVFYQVGQLKNLRCVEVEGALQTFSSHKRISPEISRAGPRINQGYLNQFTHRIVSTLEHKNGRRKSVLRHWVQTDGWSLAVHQAHSIVSPNQSLTT